MLKNEEGFEWLTAEICKGYKERAGKLSLDKGDIGTWKSLRIELQSRCNISEVQAYNILRGKNVRDYLNYYGILSGEIPEPLKMKEKREKDHKKKSMAEKMKEYEERIADLESQMGYNLSDFGFEEKD